MISEQTKEYFELGKRNDVREHAKRLRRQFLRYKDAEIVYSIHHKKLLEMANKAGAIYRIDGTVLINRDIFDQYLEQFHEPSTLTQAEEKQFLPSGNRPENPEIFRFPQLPSPSRKIRRFSWSVSKSFFDT